MAVKISTQIDRVEDLMQNNDASAFTRDQVMLEHQDSLTRLSRHNLFGEILWVNAVADTGIYTLDADVIEVQCVLYNEYELHYVTEFSRDRIDKAWGTRPGEPKYWTQDNLAPNQIRIIPAPLRTGSTVPVLPALPMLQNPVDNLVLFVSKDLGVVANNENRDFPALDLFEDVCVFDTVSSLCERETDWQNLPMAEACRQLKNLWLSRMGVT